MKQFIPKISQQLTAADAGCGCGCDWQDGKKGFNDSDDEDDDDEDFEGLFSDAAGSFAKTSPDCLASELKVRLPLCYSD